MLLKYNVYHLVVNSGTTTFFNNFYITFQAVGRLGGQSMKQECDNLKTKILDQTNQEIMLDIKRSNDEIRELKQSVESLKTANADLTEEVEKLKDTVPWNIRGKNRSNYERYSSVDLIT